MGEGMSLRLMSMGTYAILHSGRVDALTLAMMAHPHASALEAAARALVSATDAGDQRAAENAKEAILAALDPPLALVAMTNLGVQAADAELCRRAEDAEATPTDGREGQSDAG